MKHSYQRVSSSNKDEDHNRRGVFCILFSPGSKKETPSRPGLGVYRTEAIDNISLLKKINAPLGLLFLLIEKLTKKIKPDADTQKIYFKYV